MENKENVKLKTLKNSILLTGIKNVLLPGVIYFIGYMNWSIAWIIIPVIVGIFNDERKKRNLRRRNLIREASMGNEQDIILENIADLPAWVYFPDVERAEWINKIIKQLWPNVNHYAHDIIKYKIENILKINLEKYTLKGFKFQRIILGSVPFRIGGVIVYDNVSRDEIVMDLDVSYAGDCDIKFRLRGLNGGIKNFQLYGRMRVVLKPLIRTLPLAGGLQVFFLNNPDIEFDLDGIAGILEIPGVNDLLKKSIVDTVSSLMVLPNKFPIRLSKEVTGVQLKTPNPAGVLRVHVIEAKDLVKMDIGFPGKGKSDPYTVLEVGDQTYRTETIDNSVNPKWDYWCEDTVEPTVFEKYEPKETRVSRCNTLINDTIENGWYGVLQEKLFCVFLFIILEFSGQELNLHVWDQDATDDESLGRVSIDTSNLIKAGQSDMWLSLEEVKHGKIHIRCTWMSLSTEYLDLQTAIYETQQLQLTYMNTALLIIFVDSATNLPQVKISSKPNPYVHIQIGKQVKQTRAIMRTVNPVWEEGFIFLINNPDSDTIDLKLVDAKTCQELCSLTYNISNLSNKENLEIVQQPFRLFKGTSESKIVWSLHLKILKNENLEENIEEVLRLRRQSSSSNSSRARLEKQNSDNSLFSNTLTKEEFLDRNSKSSTRSSTRSNASYLRRHSKSSYSKSSDEPIIMGQINLTLRYSVQRQRLIIVVHSVANMPFKEETLRNLYVKLYLLPERNKDGKRKTFARSSNSPTYDETFDYLISRGELSAKKLEVSVIEEKRVRNVVLGQVIIDLSKFDILKTHTNWFELGPHLRD